jgi:hypothetical protein
MEQAKKGLFVIAGVTTEKFDAKLIEMNDPNAKWQCPCVIEPCYMI